MAILDTDAQQEVNESGIYSQLRQNILELRLKPGAIMSIKDICEHFDVGRSPARDALIHLEQEACLSKGDIRRFMDLDDAFHDVFYENTGHRHLSWFGSQKRSLIEKYSMCLYRVYFRSGNRIRWRGIF